MLYDKETIAQLALNAADAHLFKLQLMESYKEHSKTIEELKECKKEQEISRKKLIESCMSEMDLIESISGYRKELQNANRQLKKLSDNYELDVKLKERRSRKGRGKITRFS